MDASTTEPRFDPADEEPQPAAPDATPVPEKKIDPSESGGDVVDKAVQYGADAAIGIARGAETAVRGIRSNARALADVTGLASAMGEGESIKEPLTFGTPEPQTLAGSLTAGLTEAALSWVVGGKVAKAAGVAIKGATVAGAAAQTGLGSVFTSDPNHERLSNILQQ